MDLGYRSDDSLFDLAAKPLDLLSHPSALQEFQRQIAEAEGVKMQLRMVRNGDMALTTRYRLPTAEEMAREHFVDAYIDDRGLGLLRLKAYVWLVAEDRYDDGRVVIRKSANPQAMTVVIRDPEENLASCAVLTLGCGVAALGSMAALVYLLREQIARLLQ